ncbi:MAG: hypothetical protein QOG37_132 [Mycobacterium sp.]|nr:hypothetical protein [Mycobacterium sp.]
MYNPTPFVDPRPRVPGYPGFHDVRCRVVWTPRVPKLARQRIIVGDYLDADSPSGAITLGCGIEQALADLGIDSLDYEHLLTVCDLVNHQLAEQPWAELKCPQGTARIELVPR